MARWPNSYESLDEKSVTSLTPERLDGVFSRGILAGWVVRNTEVVEGESGSPITLPLS